MRKKSASFVRQTPIIPDRRFLVKTFFCLFCGDLCPSHIQDTIRTFRKQAENSDHSRSLPPTLYRRGELNHLPESCQGLFKEKFALPGNRAPNLYASGYYTLRVVGLGSAPHIHLSTSAADAAHSAQQRYHGSPINPISKIAAAADFCDRADSLPPNRRRGSSANQIVAHADRIGIAWPAAPSHCRPTRHQQ